MKDRYYRMTFVQYTLDEVCSLREVSVQQKTLIEFVLGYCEKCVCENL